MSDVNKIEISSQDLTSSWEEIAKETLDKLALSSTVIKAYQKREVELREEIYELKLTVKELKGEFVEESEN